MMSKVVFEDLGLIEYGKAWTYQEQVLKRMVDEKLSGRIPDHHLLFCEHEHVYTLGKSGHQQNLLITDEFLKTINATYFKIDRGGDITYHGPGQIVGYPIFDLEQLNLGVKAYIHGIENAIIHCMGNYGIQADRLDGAIGIWVGLQDKPGPRKICAIGVKVSRMVTMHGWALNVNTDLNYFNYINPCGFTDKGVTSMEKELGRKLDFEEVKKNLLGEVYREFGVEGNS